MHERGCYKDDREIKIKKKIQDLRFRVEED